MDNQVKKGNFLDELLKGLNDAVAQAQSLANNQHIESLKPFLNEDGTPKCMDINFLGGIFKGNDTGAISVDLGASILPFKNNYANLKVTFEGTDPPEGVVRLNNNLIKQIP